MAFVVAAAVAVWGAIASAAAAVVSVITTVVSAIASAISAVVSFVSGALTIISTYLEVYIGVSLSQVFSFVSTIYTVYQCISAFTQGNYAAGISGVVGAVGNIYNLIGDNLQGFVGDIAEGFGQFIEAIHLKEVINLSNIAYLVSDDYRQMMSNVYIEIGNVSKTLGNSPEFMNVLLRDAKLSVLQTASLMGRKYDVGELTWIKTLQDFLKYFSSNANSYYKNPSKMIQDIDSQILKPAYDAQGSVFQNLYGIVETTLASSKKVLEEVGVVDERITEVVNILPEEVRRELSPYLQQIRDEYTQIVDYEITPRLVTVELLVKHLKEEQSLSTKQLQAAYTIMQDPSQFLSLIDRLTDDKRAYCEDYLAELSSRSYRRTTAALTDKTTSYIERLNAISRALGVKLKKPSWDVGELEQPSRPPDTPVEPRKTWFVGDY